VKPALHRPQDGWVAKKVQDAYLAGMLDTWVGNNGHSAWIELKVIPKWPVRDTTAITVALRPEQKNYARDIITSFNRALALVGVLETQDWLLFDVADLLDPDIDFKYCPHNPDHDRLPLMQGGWGRKLGDRSDLGAIMRWVGAGFSYQIKPSSRGE
jgi:hypothetical protein